MFKFNKNSLSKDNISTISKTIDSQKTIFPTYICKRKSKYSNQYDLNKKKKKDYY